MRVISIDAPCNGSGKTSVILSILSAFPNKFAFTKFTTIYGDEQFCPAKDHDCACHRLRGDYNICTDAEVLSKPDTDTGKVRHLKPSLRVAVVNPLLPKSWWKDNAEKAIFAADLVVVNPHQTDLAEKDVNSNGDIQDLLKQVRQKSLRGSLNPLGQWEDPRLLEAVVRILEQ
jgi:Ni2+-binding GTPase involved in maturation of urease and hydrogenase